MISAMTRKYLLLILLVLASAVQADIIGLHLASTHNPARNQSGEEFNNFNPGAYIQRDNGLTAGAYYNSDKHYTVYAGWTTPEWNRLSLTMGLATGYTPAVIPMGVLSARVLSLDNYSVRIGYIPRVEAKGAQVIHLMLEKQFR